ncbi:aldehyde dehydrogenase [Mediterraneibacter sp. NSJ-55]|uniref:Aldehyde dehydrogenase n=1 Tax=Mediterraneibacter hominis TaxID=2763054 RepID=A0A923RRC3_9FIRM|nr:aldehyde dehydrogenase family protein [Mediterraneibacter hominis]MBC5689553.1 aldehyde dehydrogenase [Mediterraneibacter hominis]
MLVYINGKKTGEDLKQMEITNPVNGQVVDTVPEIPEALIDEAVTAAREGLLEWGAYSQAKRNEIVYKYIHLYEEKKKDIAKILTLETGKTLAEAEAEFDVCTKVTRGYCEMAAHLYGNCMPGGSTLGNEEKDIIFTRREPLGVMAIILPFNYPVDLFSHKVMPALVAGNSVIVKPPTNNPLAITMMVELLYEAGVPKRAVQVVTGRGSKVGDYLCGNPGLDAISMTGSTEVGTEIYKKAAANLTRVFLELGGNDAFIVLEDADVDLAVDEAIGSRLGNAGQICCASKRFLVHEKVEEEFTRKLIDKLSKVKMGDPMDSAYTVGCLISEKAAIQVEEQVNTCIGQGARCALGGKRYDKAFFQPTVLTDVTAEMDVAKDMEIFGPVFPIITIQSEEEAIRVANQSCYGLSGAVFSANIGRAISVSSRLQTAGNVINGGSAYRVPDLAFGGYKKSGIGREGISRTLEELTQEKNYILKGVL